jgi:DNA polymerase III epsilon subunit-like protein
MQELLRYNKSQKYFLFDKETMNLNTCFGNLPWEVGYLVCTLDKIIEEKVIYIKWPKDIFKMSQDAARITRFWEKEYLIKQEGLEPEEALEMFDAHLYNKDIIPVAHNGLNFDIGLHSIWRKKCKKPIDYSYINNILDTHCLARAWKTGVPIPKDRTELQALMWKMTQHRVRGMKTSISVLMKEFGIELDADLLHSVGYDNRCLREILIKLIWTLEI